MMDLFFAYNCIPVNTEATTLRFQRDLQTSHQERGDLKKRVIEKEPKDSIPATIPIPRTTKNTNTMAIQEILDAYGFKDLWAHGDNEAQEQERPKLHHFTHWNHDHTRGVHIDRLYTNFAIHGNIKVTTWHHPGLDHRGVLYTWSNTPHTKEEPPPRPLPHRAFELKSVRLRSQQENNGALVLQNTRLEKLLLPRPTPSQIH
jgi:hypothetical protein